MQSAFPTADAIQEIESRQDKVLRMLDELEQRIAQTLAACGDERYTKSIKLAAPTAAPADLAEQPLRKAA